MAEASRTRWLCLLLLLVMLACGFTLPSADQQNVKSIPVFSANYDKIRDLVKGAGESMDDETGSMILAIAAFLACDPRSLKYLPEVVRVEETYLKFVAVDSGMCKYLSPVNQTVIDLSGHCDREEAKLEFSEALFTTMVSARVFIMESALLTRLQWRLTKGEDFLSKYMTLIFKLVNARNVTWKHDPELVMKSIDEIYREYYAKYIKGVSSDSTLNFPFIKSVSYLYGAMQEAYDMLVKTRTDVYGIYEDGEITNYANTFCGHLLNVRHRFQTVGKNLSAHLRTYWDLKAVELAVSTLLGMTLKEDLETNEVDFSNADLIKLKMETLDLVVKALADGDLKTAVSVATLAVTEAEKTMNFVDSLNQSFDSSLRLVWTHAMKYFGEGSSVVRQLEYLEKFLVWPRHETELPQALDSYSELFVALVLLREEKLLQKDFIKRFDFMGDSHHEDHYKETCPIM